MDFRIKDKGSKQIIEELEEKISRLKSTLTAYKSEVKTLNECKKERDLYHDLSAVFATVTQIDDLFKQTITVLSSYLKIRYAGVFWLDNENDVLVYRYGKGYGNGNIPSVPRTGSLMGKALFIKKIVWAPDLHKEIEYVDLMLDPPEYNVICVPIIVQGQEKAVLRLANIDMQSQEITNSILKAMYTGLCSSFERMILQMQNARALKGLEASFSIARLLENTLIEQEILQKVGGKIPKLFDSSACIIALMNENDVKLVFKWPLNFCLGGNPQSSTIYLRNLLNAYPGGSALIENIHHDRRWAWADPKIRSLCMAGLRIRGVLKGVLLALGPNTETYTQSHLDLLGLTAAQTSITLERASYFRKQEQQASVDGLTGLLNHRKFQEVIRFEIERSKRYNRPLTLIIFDIDHFKKFNDTYGHQVGDEVLKMVARTAKCLVRINDRIFRYGGEEFCVLLPETKDENACHFAERLRKRIEGNKAVRDLSVTISSGVTSYKQNESIEAFIKRADDLLYKSKEHGRNRVTVG